MGKKEKKRAPWSPLSLIILVLCGIVFFGSAAYLGLYVKDKLTAEKNFSQVAKLQEESLEDVYAKNNDTVGWLKIKDTKIDYPVMKSREEAEYYLYRDFDRNYSDSGTPFLDENSVIGSGAGSYTDDDSSTWNWLVYGHNMKFGTMFHDLLKYDDKDFFDKHKTFTFDILVSGDGSNTVKVEKGTYEVVAAARSELRPEASKEFKYYKYAGYSDKEKFNEYVKGIKKESIYDTGITPEYGDQLVTLSTCAYHTSDGRFYVVARKVNE